MKWKIIGVIAMLTVVYLVYYFCPINVNRIDNIYIQIVVDDDLIKTIDVSNKEHVSIIKKALKEDTFIENPSTFVAGKYRIVVKQKFKKIELYPYCGDLAQIRVNKNGLYFYSWGDNLSIYNIINQYIKIQEYQGIYEW